MLSQERRNVVLARKLLKNTGVHPETIITTKLVFYRAFTGRRIRADSADSRDRGTGSNAKADP